MRLATRHHANGWMSVIEERRDGDELYGFAVAPDGLIHRPAPPSTAARKPAFSYDTRKAAAQAAADRVVASLAGHCDCCGCEPWEDWPDRFTLIR